MSSAYKVAVVGATGAVGEAMIDILQARQFPIETLFPLGSERSAGNTIPFNGSHVKVQNLADFDFNGIDIALFSAGGNISEQYAPIAADAGAVVIDNTSHFRYEPDIPLVVPEVNPDSIAQYRERNIIANPNCSTIQMVVALKPIYDAVGIKRINVATYQAVSGAGKPALEELAGQTISLMNSKDIECETFPKQIAFNALPHIDVFLDNGYTKEEMKMVWETQKIMNDPNILVNPTAVRIPVFYGHSEAIHIETEHYISAEDARGILENAPGVVVIDDTKKPDYPTAALDATNQDPVFIGRIRNDISHPNGLNLWVVSDNVRKGAALNSVQIAEHLIKLWESS